MSSPNEGSKSLLNTKDISTSPWLLHLLQIHDSAFPTGSFAHSFGMETYIQEETLGSKEDLFAFCKMYLRHNLGSTDGIIVKEAHELAKEKDLAGLMRLENICHGIKLSSESRKGSAMLGRQFLRTVGSLNEDELLTSWREKIRTKEIKGHYPVIYGIYTADIALPTKLLLETYLYSSVSALVQNAVRAVPLGQKQGVETVFALLPIIQEVAASVMTKNLADLDNNAIALEISSMQHEFLYSRLFMS